MVKKPGLKIFGIGSALVDTFFSTNGHTAEQLFAINQVTTITKQQAALLTTQLRLQPQAAGGLTANTLRYLAKLGADCTFYGTVGKDSLASVFYREMQQAAVKLVCKVEEGETGKVFVRFAPHHVSAITFYPGVAQLLDPAIPEQLATSDYNLLYTDGYQLLSAKNQKIIRQAIEITKAKQKQIAFGLPAVGYVKELRTEIFATIVNCDLVFGNLQEYLALFQVNSLKELVPLLKQQPKRVGLVLTNAQEGALFVEDGETFHFTPEKTEQIKDYTGAGDVFAATFVFGWLKRYNTSHVGLTAAKAAAKSLAKLGIN